MNDGGMRSVRFRIADNRQRRFGQKIAEAAFTDEDGTLASAVVNVDQNGELFELDIWKVNFSPLKRYLRPEELHLQPVASPEAPAATATAPVPPKACCFVATEKAHAAQGEPEEGQRRRLGEPDQL
jgi:hypothetical protein